MNLQVTFDPNNITSVDEALNLIERLHPTVLTDRARSKERRVAEKRALDEIASRGCTCTGTGGRHTQPLGTRHHTRDAGNTQGAAVPDR